MGFPATWPADCKAFNNIYAAHLLTSGRPAGTPGRIALPVAGDEDRAKAVMLKLIDKLGFDGVDAGGLDESWRQQPGTPVYGAEFDAEGVRRALTRTKNVSLSGERNLSIGIDLRRQRACWFLALKRTG